MSWSIQSGVMCSCAHCVLDASELQRLHPSLRTAIEGIKQSVVEVAAAHEGKHTVQHVWSLCTIIYYYQINTCCLWSPPLTNHCSSFFFFETISTRSPHSLVHIWSTEHCIEPLYLVITMQWCPTTEHHLTMSRFFTSSALALVEILNGDNIWPYSGYAAQETWTKGEWTSLQIQCMSILREKMAV